MQQDAHDVDDDDASYLARKLSLCLFAVVLQ